MKPKSTLIGATNAVTPSKWIQAALMTFALFAALVVAGCDRSDDSDHRDSDHRMNHGNQNHPTGGNN
jgi:hypothetical protein